MRELIKSFLNNEQKRKVRTAINSMTWIYRKPLGLYRRRGLENRVPYRPGGRRWSSAIPFDLHISIQQGTIDYVYRDVPMLKHPIEMALYSSLVWKLKPRTIIEIGSKYGGSALWFADLMKTYGIDGRVVSLDIEVPTPPYRRDDIIFMYGDANKLGETVSPEFLASLPRPFLIVEDASHHYRASLATLRFFKPFMRKGEYIVVEDGNVSDMGDDGQREGGPGRAISEFLMESKDRFEIDTGYCDHFGHNVTGNPNGYLRCIRD
jgi:cephalosporin hydroxylase